MKNADYWKKRAEELENMAHQSATETAKLVNEQYIKALSDIDKEIRSWYQKFADNNKMTMADAKKVLTSAEVKAFRMDLKEYIAMGEKLNSGVRPEWIKQMKSASAVHHIERLDALKMRTQQACERLAGSQLVHMDNMAKKVYREGYYGESYTIQKGVGLGWQANALDEAKMNTVIRKPWAPDGKDFSSRIWENKSKLVNELHTEITQGCITGKPVDTMAKNLANRMGVSESNARRLVQTEAAHFASAADLQSYKDCSMEKYQYLATLDSSTSEICADMDGQVFELKDFEEGMTAPPMHPNCRSTTIPYFDDEFTEDEMRAARDEDGKTTEVPADMTYKDWENQFVGRKMSVKNAIRPETAFLSSLENHDIIKSVKSYTDATDILTSLGVSKVSNIEKLNIDTAKHITAGVSDIKSAFPDIDINSISVGKVSKGYGSFSTGSCEMTFSQKHLEKDLTCAYTTAIHESAHAVDRYLSVNTLGNFSGYAGDVVSRALKRLGVIRDPKKLQLLRYEVGGKDYYMDDDELFARAFELNYIKRDSKLSNMIMRIVKEDYNALHSTGN
ncbi:MAG: minor capsid protein [Eubacteriaceae bacterium]|nr:minor capsid protein [Eubacteriaceae bacterium]